MEASIVETDVPGTEAGTDAIDHTASMIMETEIILQPVPYAGDETQDRHSYPPVIDGGFWITKPA